MSENFCPICYTKLTVKEVSPCEECGHLEEELNHYKSHRYAEMRIFGELSLILCDFCQVDFGSYNPEFFGLPHQKSIGLHTMQFIRSIENVSIRKDKCCPECHHRLPFLRFVCQARELHQKDRENNL